MIAELEGLTPKLAIGHKILSQFCVSDLGWNRLRIGRYYKLIIK
jgi:hypothetical protein